MFPGGKIQDEKRELASIAGERRALEEKLAGAGGREFGVLLSLCEDLSDIIEDISEISSKKSKMEHAAFETKVKFSRKMRRKAKDLGRLEQEIVQAFDGKHITLEHGRKMAEIVKMLRSGKADKARQEAGEFYSLIDASDRLKGLEESLLKKRAQLERDRRNVSGLISDIDWLSGQQAPDMVKAGRHEERELLLEALLEVRSDCLFEMQAMPFAELVAKARSEGLIDRGFPAISGQDAQSLTAFLRRSGLDKRTAGQLFELASQSEMKLRHLGIDLAGFRNEVAGRRAYLSQLMALQPSAFLSIDSQESPAIGYLAGKYEKARKAADRLSELAKTAYEDEKEWERAKMIEAKKTGLNGMDKASLKEMLDGIEELGGIMDGKAQHAPDPGDNSPGGLAGSLRRLIWGR